MVAVSPGRAGRSPVGLKRLIISTVIGGLPKMFKTFYFYDYYAKKWVLRKRKLVGWLVFLVLLGLGSWRTWVREQRGYEYTAADKASEETLDFLR
jgi:uncharacterized membrane protein YdjX (TVP38/TMEM64 family)